MGPLHPALQEKLRRGATVLTASQRAAHSLRRVFDQAMRDAGHKLWEPPSVFALDTWMRDRWQTLLLHGAETKVLLNRSQEQSIWQAILSADQEIPGLRSLDNLAELASRAWHLLCLYEGRSRLQEFALSTDTSAFLRWAREFEGRCARSLYLPSAQLPAALAHSLLRSDRAPRVEDLTLLDFDTLPPAYRRLVDTLRSSGCCVDELQTAVSSGPAHLYSASTEHAELHTAAAWVRQQLEDNPGARIAVVVPALEARRSTIERVFNEVLAPELQSITASSHALPYQFSLGHPLDETAEAAAALDLLRWTIQPLAIERISALLLSPCFGVNSQDGTQQTHAAFDVFELRRTHLLRPQLSLDATIDLILRSKRRAQLGDLLFRLRAMRTVAAAEQMSTTAPPALRSHADWTDAFRSVLTAAGWARDTARDSLVFRAQQRWERALDETATLSFDGSRLTAAAAVDALAYIAGKTIFAPEGGSASVQILGPLELGGVPFDALWFLGADNLSWPASSAPNPLLSWQLRQSLDIPDSTSTSGQVAAQHLTQRIARSASNVVFSYANQSDEGNRKLSSALHGFTLLPLACQETPLERQPLPFDLFLDDVPLPSLPDAVIRGGANILELQAACGFRAFAERRLWSTEPDRREPGLDARERGSAVHKIMEALWSTLGSQAALRALSIAEREALLDVCIETGLTRAASLAHAPWEIAYMDVQRVRLRLLLRPWLVAELARPTFTVRAQERAIAGISIGPLQLDLRVDRIDETAGGTLIIDYKTGPATPANWLSDRPDAPQLPLYAVLADSPHLAGVAFALLRAGNDLGLKGFADDPAVLPKSSRMPTGALSSQVDQWREVLTALAVAFAQGDAAVAPKSYPKTCTHCAQRILCRLDVANLEPGEEDDDFDADLSSAEPDMLARERVHG